MRQPLTESPASASSAADNALASVRTHATWMADLAFGNRSVLDRSHGPGDTLCLDLSDEHQRRLGDYELLEVIGQGGMGIVYRARQLGLDRDVALKLLAAGPWATVEYIERFRREAQNAARMQHPNIVAIYEVGTAEDLHFFSMRLVHGETLAQLLDREGALSPRRAAALLLPVARAIGYAHGLEVLHLDLKPANVLLDEEGAPQVADFGLAQRIEDGLGPNTDEIAGTPSYMAPEQAVAGGKSSAATDVWGLGAILYEMLAGRPPFLADSAQATLQLAATRVPATPRSLVPALPRDIEAIVLKCLVRDPPQRYASAQALADDLAAFLARRPVRARPQNAAQRFVYWLQREPRFAILCLAFITLLAGAGIAWHSTQPPSTPATTTPATQPTLVLLPLRAVGDAKDEVALADGLSEELTTRLAKIEGLSLISQTSATLAQERKLDLNQLVQQLHVTHAIEGSLRESGDQLRIDLRLVEVPSGKTVWAQDYDRKLADVFAIQSEIAQAVSSALALRLGLAAQSPAGDVDIALYREYLELRGALLKPDFTPGTPHQNAAREALRALIARAPGYARAHGLLARSLSTQITPAFHPSAAQLDEAAHEAALALKLDTDNSDTHVVLAELAGRRMDWETSIAEYRRALTLDPTDVTTRGRYALRLSGIGYLDAALSEFDTAHRSDPLETTINWQRARVLDTLGRHDEAKKAHDDFLKLNTALREPSSYSRWHNAVWRHDYAEAKESVSEMPEREGFREAYLAVTAALQDASLWPQALKAIEQSERRSGRYNFARLLGPSYDAKAVFDSFEPMLQDGFPSYFLLVWQPEYAALRHNPAFQDFLRRTHIIDYWRAHGFPVQCKPEGDGARCD